MKRETHTVAPLTVALFGVLCFQYPLGCASQCEDGEGLCELIHIKADNQPTPPGGTLEVTYLGQDCQVLEQHRDLSFSALPVRLAVRHDKNYTVGAVKQRIIVLRNPDEPSKNFLSRDDGQSELPVQLNLASNHSKGDDPLEMDLAAPKQGNSKRLAVLPGTHSSSSALGIITRDNDRIGVTLVTPVQGGPPMKAMVQETNFPNAAAFSIVKVVSDPAIRPFLVVAPSSDPMMNAELFSPGGMGCWANSLSSPQRMPQPMPSSLIPLGAKSSPTLLWLAGGVQLNLVETNDSSCALTTFMTGATIYSAVAGVLSAKDGTYGIVAGVEADGQQQLRSWVFDGKKPFHDTPTVKPIQEKSPSLFALGDVNRDSFTDLVFASGQKIFIQYGSLLEMTSEPTPWAQLDAVPQQLALADMNGDAALDLVVRTDGKDGNAGQVEVYLGYGDAGAGVIRSFQKIPAANRIPADEMELADLDNSCQPSLVVINGGNVQLYTHSAEG